MSNKEIVAIVSITIPALVCFHVGLPYIGNLIGNMVYLLSVLFLIAFVVVNIFYRQKIEDLSKGKLYFICITYLSVIPLIYLINSLKPPSKFLIFLFLFYFFLALMWTFIAEKKRLTNACIVLFILCLFPLIFGLSIHWIYEESIYDEIKYLDNQKEYYENHFDNLNYGFLTRDRTDSTKNNIRELEENIEEAKECYSVADFSRAWENIEAANKNNNNIKRTFELLDPEKSLYNELRGLDKDLVQLNAHAYSVNNMIDPEEVYKVERILSDIIVTESKTDEAWNLYRNGKYEQTCDYILQINANISDIEENLDRIEISSLLPSPEPDAVIPEFAILALPIILIMGFILMMRARYMKKKKER